MNKTFTKDELLSQPSKTMKKIAQALVDDLSQIDFDDDQNFKDWCEEVERAYTEARYLKNKDQANSFAYYESLHSVYTAAFKAGMALQNKETASIVMKDSYEFLKRNVEIKEYETFLRAKRLQEELSL